MMLFLYEVHSSKVCKTIGDYFEGKIDIGNNRQIYSKRQILMHALGYFIKEYPGMLKQISMPNFCLGTEELMVLIDSLKYRSEQLLLNKVGTSDLIFHLRINDTFSDPLLNSFIELLESYPISKLQIKATNGIPLQVLSQLLYSRNSLNVLNICHTNITQYTDIPVCSANNCDRA